MLNSSPNDVPKVWSKILRLLNEMLYCYHLLIFEILWKYWVNLGHGYSPYQPVQNSIHQQHQPMICVSSHILSMVFMVHPLHPSQVCGYLMNQHLCLRTKSFRYCTHLPTFPNSQAVPNYIHIPPVLATKGWILSCQCKQPKSCQCNDSTSKAKTLRSQSNGWEVSGHEKLLEFSKIWIRHSNSCCCCCCCHGVISYSDYWWYIFFRISLEPEGFQILRHRS